jgi:outer membrane protein OmpA-like peptidoglycan-associated protein
MSFKAYGVLLLGLAASACTGGGGRGDACTPHTWQGMCVLQSLQTVRITESFPRSLVTLEVLYVPEPNASDPRYAPPEIKNTIRAFADDEQGLRAHLQKYTPVRCTYVGPSDETCGAGHADVDVPPFVPPAENVETNTPKGCAALDADQQNGTQPQPPSPEQVKALGFPDRVLFDADSASVSAAAASAIQQAASALNVHPSVECVAVVGHVTHGEAFGLAEDRARAVRQALIAAGVDATRVRVFGAAVSMYGEGAPLPPNADERNVQFKILGYKKP